MKFALEEKTVFFLWPLVVTKRKMLLVCELHMVDVYDLMNSMVSPFNLYLEPK